MAGVAPCGMVACVASEAVTVAAPAVLKVKLKVFVPLASGVFVGKMALASLEVSAMVSLVITGFQLASTAATATLNAVPAACGEGVPVLPLAVPGAAVSPGANNCNLANTPALTLTAELVLAALLPSLRS